MALSQSPKLTLSQSHRAGSALDQGQRTGASLMKTRLSLNDSQGESNNYAFLKALGNKA